MRRVMIALAALACAAAGAPAQAAKKLPLPPSVTVPPLPAGAVVRPFRLTRVAIQLPPDKDWGEHQFGIFCPSQGRLVWADTSVDLPTKTLESIVFREAARAGFRFAGEGDNLFEEPVAPEFALGGALRDMNARFCIDDYGSGFFTKGEIVVDMEWQVYSTIDKEVIARIPTRGGYSGKADGRDYGAFIVGAFAENVKGLLASEEFRKLVSSDRPATPAAERLKPAAMPPLRLVVDKSAKPGGVAGAMSSVVLILAPSGHGSGFLVSNDGYIITNEHVVKSAREVRIRWSDGSETRGAVERADKRRDVALIKTDPGARKPLLFRTAPPVVGETVLAIGAPLDVQFQGTVTRGIVSTPDRMYGGLRYVQSDVMVNEGNSGGPLLDEQGRVVAITDLGYTGGQEGPTGINLFVPIDDAARFLNAHQ